MNRMNLFGSEKKNNLIHYEGELGIFDYDPREFKIEKQDVYNYDRLHYCGSGKLAELPYGCTNVRHMFEDCILPDGFSLGESFHTSKVTSMRYMFAGCRLPEGFSLGEHFNTSNVTDMVGMFCECELPDGFTLGGKFDTSKVIDMHEMFEECKLPEGFSLGEYFDTSNVIRMDAMFCGCKLPDGFSFGGHFDTSNVTNMEYMFCRCKLPGGFTLGERFDTSRVTDMLCMFKDCILPEGFSLGECFDTSNIFDMEDMFDHCSYGNSDLYDYFKTQSDSEIIEKLKLQNMSLSNETKSVVRQDLIPLEIGYGILERLHIQVEYSEEKTLALSLGEQYVDYCKAVSPEAPARISDVSTVIVPLKFVEFVMTKMKCDIPFGSNVLILRDFLDQYNIKLELYRGTSYALYDEAYKEHTPLYVGDFISYCDSFIHICSVEKTTDDCKQNVGQLLSPVLERVPTVFSAGYMYRSEYDCINEDSNLLYLPEKLRDRYKETMGAVDINDSVGCCEDAIVMATFPKDLEPWPNLQKLLALSNEHGAVKETS